MAFPTFSSAVLGCLLSPLWFILRLHDVHGAGVSRCTVMSEIGLKQRGRTPGHDEMYLLVRVESGEMQMQQSVHTL